MNDDTVSNTLASIYNISDFHIGALSLDLLFGSFSGSAAIVTFSALKMLGGLVSAILLLMFVINFVRTDRFLRARANLLKTLIPPRPAQSRRDKGF